MVDVSSMFKFIKILFLVLSLFNWYPVNAQQLSGDAPELRGIDVKEHMGERIPLDLTFTNEKGETVRLADYFQKKGKPVVLTLAYYECPMLCTLVLNGLGKAVEELDWIPGDNYELLTISIDPNETAELANAKRDRYVKSIGKEKSQCQWNFWVGKEEQIKRLADAVGFHYFYDKKQDEYAHPAVAFILTENGLISRYLYGIEFSAKDLRLSLLEASQGKIGNVIDRVLLYCYHYDPVGKKYALMASNVMRLGGVATVLSLGFFLGILWFKEKAPSQ